MLLTFMYDNGVTCAQVLLYGDARAHVFTLLTM